MNTLHPSRLRPVKLLALISCALTGFIIPKVQSQLIQENFLTGAGNYSTGSVVGQNPTVPGFSGAWATPGTSTASISSTNLTYSNPSGTVSSAGGSLFIDATGGRVFRNLSSTVDVNSNTTIYVSLMMQNSLTGNATQYRAFELKDSSASGDAGRILQLGFSNSDFGTLNYGFRVNNSNSLQGNLGISNTSTNFFVIKLTLSSTPNQDAVTIWANPTNLGSEALSGPGVTLTGFSFANNFSRVQFSGFTAGTTNFDALRIGDSWQTVSTIPEPSTWVLLAASLTGLVVMRRRRRRF